MQMYKTWKSRKFLENLKIKNAKSNVRNKRKKIVNTDCRTVGDVKS